MGAHDPPIDIRGVRMQASSCSNAAEGAAMLDCMKAAGVNVVYYPVWLSTAYYNSSLLNHNAFDSLDYMAGAAHERGMEIYAHMPCGKMFDNGAWDAGLSETWIDWTVEAYRDFTVDLAEELAEYDVDGIFLDYIRWPEDLSSTPITQVVTGIRNALPDITLAVSPFDSPSFACNDRGQCWESWLDDELVDYVTPMAYRTNSVLQNTIIPAWDATGHWPDRIIPRLGVVWFNPTTPKTVAEVFEQIKIVRDAGATGLALWDDRYISWNPSLVRALARENWGKAVFSTVTHDDGTTGEYDSTSTSGSGSISITTAARKVGGYGVQASVSADNDTAYGQMDISDQITPMRIGMFVALDNLSVSSDDTARILFMSSDLAAVNAKYDGGAWQLRVEGWEDDSSRSTGGYFTITSGWHWIELAVTQAETNVSSDGGVRLYVDGLEVSSVSSLDNYDAFDDATDVYAGCDVSSSSPSGSVYYDHLSASEYQSDPLPIDVGYVFKNDWALEGLWLMNEESGTRYDETDKDNDLTDNNTVGSSTTRQEGSRSADFEAGNSETLSITNGSQTGLDIEGELSIVAWVRPESLSGDMAIVAKYHTSGNERGYEMIYDQSESAVSVILSGNGTAYTSATGATDLAVDTWTHVAMVYDGSEIRVYIDGVLDSNGSDNPSTYSSGIHDTSAPFEIGGREGIRYWDGLIDEVAVFSRPLSDEEVWKIYEKGILSRASTTVHGFGDRLATGVFGGITR